MARCIALLALFVASCGGFGSVRKIGGREVGVQDHTVGAVRLVSFVNVEDSIVDADAGASFAMVLPGGDWLASVNGAVMRLSPDGTKIRWSTTGLDLWEAVAGAERRVVAVGTIADPEALNGAARSLFALDTDSGAIVWRTEADPISRGARAKLARVGAITVAASAYGEAGVDDSGKVAWVNTHDHGNDPLLAPIAGGVVVISTPLQYAHELTGGPPIHRPVEIRTLDIATGAPRGQFSLPAEHDYFSLGQLGLSADGRIAIEVADTRVNVKPYTTEDGKPGVVHTNDTTARLLLVAARDPARPSARAVAMPKPEASATPATLGPSEIVLVDRYATDGEALSLRVVDLDTQRVRRVPLLRTAKNHTYVQLTQLAVHPDQISFAGQYTGRALPLKARVEEVDRCEAQRGVECFGTDGTVTLSPAAGVIGTVAFRRTPVP